MITGIILVGAVVYAVKGGGTNGDKEFKSAQTALRQVKSWKYTVTSLAEGGAFDDTEGEGDCAVGFHQKRHYGNRNFDPPVDVTDETAALIAGRAYQRGPDGTWQSGRNTFSPGSIETCRTIAQGGDISPFPRFDDMLKHGNIATGEKKTVNGTTCQAWKVTMLRANTQIQDVRTVCIGIDNHLPVEMTSGKLRTTYSNLNEKFFIELPAPE